jgi:hypothetical protein
MNPSRKPLGTHHSFHDLMLDYDLLIPPARLAKWRLLFPNVGELSGFPHFGNVMIAATDGLEAFYHVDDSGFLWKGHLKAFSGPVAKVYVWEEDWDYVNHKRKVDVRKRADGSIVVIPRDSFWQEYWEKHPRTEQWEKDLWSQLLTIDGMTIHWGNIRFADFDEAHTEMQQRSSSASPARPRKKEMTKRQRILATL